MAGKAIMIGGVYSNTLGMVTLIASSNLASISILGNADVQASEQYSIVYNPSDTEELQKGVMWALYSDVGCISLLDESIATITAGGLVTVKNTGSSSKGVYIKATSTFDAEISAVLNVTLAATSVINNKEIKMLINVPSNNYEATIVFENSDFGINDIVYGDGTSGIALKHTYATAGDYNVILRKSTDIISIGSSALAYVRAKIIIIPPTVTSIVNYSLYNNPVAVSLLVYAETPPSLIGNAMTSSNYTNIYVPDASVNNYKAYANWSYYASNIKGLSQYVG